MLLEKATSEQIEDVLAMLNEMGIRVVEIEEAEPDEEEQCAEAEEESEEGAIIELQRTTPAKVKKPELPERTDDPVRMYLREGSVELLSREGEIAIDKRIEGGREAMIAAPPAAPVGPTPFQPAAGANTTAPTAKAGTRARKPRSPIPVSTPEELSLPIRCSSSRDGVPTASVRDAGRLNMSLRSDRRRLDRYRP
jgi:hypothetical protein